MPKSEMSKSGIGQWLSLLPQQEKERIGEDNSRMVENVRALGLPMDTDFGDFNSPEEVALGVPVQVQQDAEAKFIFRCESLEDRSVVRRKLFVSFSEGVLFFADLLAQGFSCSCNVREVKDPDFAGTFIIDSKKRKLVIEFWPGRHLELDNPHERQQGFRVSSGIYCPEAPTFDQHVHWSENSGSPERSMAIRAVRHLDPGLQLSESWYVEYYWQHQVGVRFIALSQDSFWTQL